MYNSKFYQDLNDNPRLLAEFCVTQLSLIMSCERKQHWQGRVRLPMEEEKIIAVRDRIASAFYLAYKGEAVKLPSSNDNAIVIATKEGSITLKPTASGLDFETLGGDPERIINRGQLLAAIGHEASLKKPDIVPADVVYKYFNNINKVNKAVVDQSQIKQGEQDVVAKSWVEKTAKNDNTLAVDQKESLNISF